MNKKGFTLIELLAVIIILAVIALIATPVVLDVIEKSKKEALKDSAYGLINSAKFYSYQYEIKDTVRFDINDNVVTGENNDKITFNGKIENGIVLINSSNEVALCINENEYSAYKNFKDNNVILADNKNCDIPTGYSIIYLAGEATIKEYTNHELTQMVQELQSEINSLKNNTSNEAINPTGTVISYMGNNVPKGYLSCDGSIYNISDYSILAEQIKTEFGSYNYYGGDGITTFAVPDLRGEFLRGTGSNSHTYQGNGAAVGSHQDATSIPGVYIYDNGIVSFRHNTDETDYTYIKNDDGHISSGGTIESKNIQSNTGTSSMISSNFNTRPTNTSVLYCIKY